RIQSSLRLPTIELDALDELLVTGTVLRVRRGGLQLVDHVHAVGHLAEHRVLPVEPWALGGRDDEELRAVRVGAGIRHRQRTAYDAVLVRLVLERVAGTAGSRSLRAASLDHELLDDAVEREAVVEALTRQAAEVVNRVWRVL